MSDKSPRQTMTKKSGKSLKEKRSAKRTKAAQISQTEALLHPRVAELGTYQGIWTPSGRTTLGRPEGDWQIPTVTILLVCVTVGHGCT